jgi:GntR family transcriptional repressor for pyruvate dehydrogenase complex
VASRPAYQQVAEHLRGLVSSGERAPGERLAGEAELCERYGVSRSTVREAIRLLEAQHLVVTTRGTNGGTFVAQPETGRISLDLGASLDVLIAHDALTVDQILEARRLLEVPAAGLAAERRSDRQLDELRQCVANGRSANEQFHKTLLAASGNPLVEVMCEPLFGVLRARLHRDAASADFWVAVDGDHRRLLELVEAGDVVGTAAEMERHLTSLAEVYRQLDRAPVT